MPVKKKEVTNDKKKSKRKGGRPPKDDDSVDSYGNIRDLIDYDDEEILSDSDKSTSDSSYKPKRKSGRLAKKKAAAATAHPTNKFYPKKKKQPVEESSMELEESEEDEEDDDDDDGSQAEETDAEETSDESKIIPEISFIFGGGGSDAHENRGVPKRHNMKKEPEEVQKFVKLVTEPFEDITIDDQIDYFKTLGEERKRHILEVLERRPDKNMTNNMMFKILGMKMSPEVQNGILAKYNTLQSLDPSAGEYFKLRNWLEKATSLPLGIYKDMPVKLEDGQETCMHFMDKARRCLDEAIYGQDESKMQILQFIASKISNRESRGLSLLLVGPPGIGKTCLIKNGIAKALDWPFQFISLGGESDASTYTGHQLVYEGSHCGKIANSLITSKSMSTILMFDEIDKISGTTKGEEIQNMLVHLTDPVQNDVFEDKYLSGIPIDLSKVMFVFSANDITKIDKVLLDRMMVVQLKGYNQKEKMAIAEQFLLPAALREVNLVEKVAFQKDIVEHILTEYAGEETGVRELKRCLEQVAQKVNMLRMYNSKDLQFHIKDFALPFILKKEHIDLFLKKRGAAEKDVSHLAMYT